MEEGVSLCKRDDLEEKGNGKGEGNEMDLGKRDVTKEENGERKEKREEEREEEEKRRRERDKRRRMEM